jgi:hypothetical protein
MGRLKRPLLVYQNGVPTRRRVHEGTKDLKEKPVVACLRYAQTRVSKSKHNFNSAEFLKSRKTRDSHSNFKGLQIWGKHFLLFMICYAWIDKTNFQER